MNDDYGYVESVGETPLVANPSEVAMPVFPGAGSDTQTVAEISQVASVRATAYGNPITNTAENRPFQAIDGNVDTAWTEGAFSRATDASLHIKLTHPVTTNHISLLQPQTGEPNRYVTRVTLTFDGDRHVNVALSHHSRVVPGQVVTFPRTTFRTLTVTVDATSAGTRKSYESQSAVGFAQVDIPGVPPATETLRLPTDLLTAAGTASASHQLDIVLNRARANPSTPPRTDPELTLARRFTLPTARDFSVGGLARISTLTADPVINSLVGRTTATPPAPRSPGQATVVFANSSGRLPGDLNADASAAVDGNPATSWMPGLGRQDGDWVDYQLSKPVTFDHLDLQLVADGRHSIPTVITVSTSSGSRRVVLPHIGTGKGRPQGSVTPVLAQFPALTGSNVRITIDATQPVHFLDYVSSAQNTEPVGLAEAGIPGVAALATPAQVPTRCWSNLLEIDGQPIDIAISGSSATAAGQRGPFDHRVRQLGRRHQTECRDAHTDHQPVLHGRIERGLPDPGVRSRRRPPPPDLDRRGPGEPGAGRPHAVGAGAEPEPDGHEGCRCPVTASPSGWSWAKARAGVGWRRPQSGVHLGSSTLINGYANGWYVPGSAATGTTVVNIQWQPQRVVNAAIIASSAALAASLGLVLIPPGLVSRRLARRRARRAKGDGDGAETLESARGARRGRSAAAVGSAESAQPAASATLTLDPDMQPRLSNPLRSGGRRPAWYWAAGIAVLGGLVAAAMVAPLAGLAVGAVLLLGLLVDRVRVILVLGALGLIILTDVVMARGQSIHRFVPDINWPAHFPVANSFTWLAICLLAADAIVVAVRVRSSSGRADEDDGPPEPAQDEGSPTPEAAQEGATAEAASAEGATAEPADEAAEPEGATPEAADEAAEPEAAEEAASADHGDGGGL